MKRRARTRADAESRRGPAAARRSKVVAIANKSQNPMKDLYRRLSDLGLSRAFVEGTVLPSWWEDEAASNPAGYSEALLLLSRHLGLDLSSLRDPSAELALAGGVPFKLKKSKGAKDDQLALTRGMAIQVAQLAALGASKDSAELSAPARAIRQQILEQGRPWVDLEALLDYCWAHGAPVVHVAGFPGTLRRMHGLAARVAGRPVIVICKDQKQPAWLLFILAHEIGHIVLRHHDSDNQAVVDEEIDENSKDKEEAAANAFALELLSGDSDFRVHAADRWPNATDLAKNAMQLGREHRTHPGHIILNYAHSMGGAGFFAVANAALKLIEPEADAPDLIRRKMAAKLDWSALPADASEFLMRMTQMELAAAS